MGLVTGLGFAELGNSVIFVDSDEFKLESTANDKGLGFGDL